MKGHTGSPPATMSGVMPVNPLVTLVNSSFRCGQLTRLWLTKDKPALMNLRKPNDSLPKRESRTFRKVRLQRGGYPPPSLWCAAD
jgi:hypothetical protein